MGFYKKDNRWYIDYYLPNGKRKREAVSIQGVDPSQINREDAKKALAIRKGQIAEGKFEIAQTKKPVLFDTFVKRYLEYSRANKRSWQRDATSCKFLNRYFKDKTLQQITAWSVEKYKADRQKEITRFNRPVSNATINRELACLKNMLNKAIEWGATATNPTKKVKLFPEKPVKMRVLSNEEFQKLRSAASETLKIVLTIAMYTGLRRSEILSLTWGDIDFKRGYLTVRNGKNNESRMIPMHKDLKQTLESVKNISVGDYIFAHENGDPIKSVKNGFWAALRRSGIDKCTLHDLRHSFATNLVMQNTDLTSVQELMGHKDISMTKRYSHPTPEHKKQAIDRLDFTSMDTYLDTKATETAVKPVVSVRNH